jgi:hypothetical protein
MILARIREQNWSAGNQRSRTMITGHGDDEQKAALLAALEPERARRGMTRE